jgi:hypothetical protein
MELFQENGEILSPAFEEYSRGSWLARVLFEAYQTCRRTGAAMEAGLMHERWLRNTPGFTNVRIEYVILGAGLFVAGCWTEISL